MRRLLDWYRARSPRERRLVAAMVAIAIPVALWLAVWRPLVVAHARALETYRMALDRNGRIAAMTGVRDDESPPAPVIDGSLAAWLLAQATAEGLALTRQADVADGRAEIEMTATGPAEAVRWLGTLEAEGLKIESVRLGPSAEGGITMIATIGSRP